MEWNKKYDYPSSTRALINGKRQYSLDGSNYPSVTSILSLTKSSEEKAALAAWKERVGEAEAERIKNEASSKGNSMHSIIEQFLHGRLNQELIDEISISKLMANKIIDNGLKDKLTEIWGAEATVYFPGAKGFAGTADCIGIYEGKKSILDFKSSNKPKREDYIESYFLQVGAYSLAHNEVYKSDIDQGVILICTVDGLYQDFKIAGSLLKSYQQKFLQRVDKFYEQIK